MEEERGGERGDEAVHWLRGRKIVDVDWDVGEVELEGEVGVEEVPFEDEVSGEMELELLEKADALKVVDGGEVEREPLEDKAGWLECVADAELAVELLEESDLLETVRKEEGAVVVEVDPVRLELADTSELNVAEDDGAEEV